MPYPCPTRIVAGTTAAEAKDESARMRLKQLVVQREELEERMERLDAVIGLIRRDLGDDTGKSPAADNDQDETVEKVRMEDKENAGDRATESADASEPPEDGYDF